MQLNIQIWRSERSQKLSALLKIRQQAQNRTAYAKHITKPRFNLIIVSALPEMES